MPWTAVVLRRKEPLPVLSYGSMFGDGADKTSTQMRIVSDSDSVVRTEPRTEIYMHQNDLLLIVSPIIPQLQPSMAFVAVFILLVLESFLPSQNQTICDSLSFEVMRIRFGK
jgi:hypothetical protein